MLKNRKLWLGVCVLVVGLIVISAVNAAPSGRGRGSMGMSQGGQRGMTGGPEQMKERMMAMMKTQLKATDAEWKIIEPRLEKVMELSRQTSTGGRMMGRGGMMGGRGERPEGRGEGQREGRGQGRGEGRGEGRGMRGSQDGESSAVQKAAQDLQTALQSESIDASVIKTKLTALRNARENAKQELAKAQQSLSAVLTVEQEAKLVLGGMLE